MNTFAECEPLIHAEELEEMTAKHRAKMAKVGGVTRTFLFAIDYLREHKQAELAVFYNAGMYEHLVAQDIYALAFAMAATTDRWSRYTFARSLAVVLYESAEGIPAVYGKPFRDALSTLNLLDSLSGALKEALKPINTFKSSHASALYKLRNLAGAHRHRDAFGMVSGMVDLPPPSIFNMAGELERALHSLAKFSLEAISQATKITRFILPPTPSE